MLDDALAEGTQPFERLDRIFEIRTKDGSLTRAVIWRPSGEIVYASEPGLQGLRSTPTEKVLAAVGGETVSDYR